jgi:peptidoglycan hydrolase-like protein with peptidoglycan-binding domain
MRKIAIVAIGIAHAAVVNWPSAAAPQRTLTAADVNDAQWAGKRQPGAAVVLKAQILLDRARISPGEVDGKMGENTRKAVRAFRALHDLRPGERIDEQMWQALTREQGDPVLVAYTINVAPLTPGPRRALRLGHE